MSLLIRATAYTFFQSNNYYHKFLLSTLKHEFYKKNSSKVLTSSLNVRTISLHETGHCGISDSCKVEPEKNEYVTYDDLFTTRRSQARRSILIEIQSEKSCTDVYSYCSQYGLIKSIFHYVTEKTQRHFVLIEFEDSKHVETVLAASTYVNCEQVIPVQSTMLWFRNTKQRFEKKVLNPISEPLMYQYSSKVLSDNEVFKSLIMAKSITCQMILLYNITKLNETGIRLRFYTAHQIERSFYGLFPNISVLPFGSSINGFGKQGCDLDLSVILAKNKQDNSDSRLVFQTKSNSPYEKYEIKKVMEIIADTMKILIPGISNVRKILEARVPIIKFDHTLSGIECDLSMTNMSAYYMSELLYIYGEIDYRVKPLIFTVKKWAQSLQITNKIVPGPCITNFSLSLMVIFFLQQKNILPALNLLKSYATQKDIRIADTYVDCTFQRDISRLLKITNSQSVDTPEELLLEFFTYYGNFDFETKAISVREGKTLPKPEYAALYICNPLELTLNVSKNVNFQELGKIRAAMRCAAWQLEDRSHGRKSGNWGLVDLFLNRSIERSYTVPAVDIEALFDSNKNFAIKKKLNEKKNHKRSKSKIL